MKEKYLLEIIRILSTKKELSNTEFRVLVGFIDKMIDRKHQDEYIFFVKDFIDTYGGNRNSLRKAMNGLQEKKYISYRKISTTNGTKAVKVHCINNWFFKSIQTLPPMPQ